MTRRALRKDLHQEAQAFAPMNGETGGKGAPYRVASWAGLLSGADFNSDFDGREKYGIFREMLDSDPIIGLGRMLIDGPLVAADWRIESESDELRESVESLLFDAGHEQALTWEELILHTQLSVWLGCYLFERVWWRGPDGLDRCYLSPRPPETVWQWSLNGRRLAGVTQEIVDDSGATRYVEIPGEDLVHFVFDQEGNNLEGRSILRPLYGEFISKRESRMWRNIMAERSQGFLGANPTGEGITEASRDNVIEALAGFTNHEDLHFVGSPGWEIKFLQTVSDGIERCQSIMDYTDRVILQRLLLTHMAQGMMPSGSRSVADTQEKPYWNALGAWANRTRDRIQSGLIAPFVRDNFGAAAVEEVTLRCDNLQTSSVADEIAPFVDAIARGAIESTPEIRRHILGFMHAPEDVIDAPDAPNAPDEESASAAFDVGMPSWVVDSENPNASSGILSREPEGAERFVEFESVGVAWDEAEEEARQALERFRGRFIPELAAAVEKMASTGAPLTDAQVEELMGLRRSWREQLKREIRAIGMAEFSRGRADVVDEIARIPIKPGSTRGPKLPQVQASDVKRSVADLADQAVERYAATLVVSAVAEVRGQIANAGKLEDAKRIGSILSGVSRNQPLGGIRNAISLGYNRGRSAGAAAGRTRYYTYSTLFEDGRTCAACMTHEMEVGIVGSAEDLETRLPLADCFSTRGGSGANRCRCIKIYSNTPPEELRQ